MLLFILIPILSFVFTDLPADVFQNLHDKQVTQRLP
jgi:hypothetical protein